jgi:hypothetical protein
MPSGSPLMNGLKQSARVENITISITSTSLVGPSSPEGAQLTVRGGGFLLYRYWSLVYFVCQYVVVVYISLRDDGR